jgi:hypothetical protein
VSKSLYVKGLQRRQRRNFERKGRDLGSDGGYKAVRDGFCSDLGILVWAQVSAAVILP